MIDTVYQTLLTIVNKENQGYVSPTEFNLIANNVQNEIYRGYFDDVNRDKNRENRGQSSRGYGNLDLNERQRIQQFAANDSITAIASTIYSTVVLPSDMYLIEDNGLVSGSEETSHPNTVIEEVNRHTLSYLLNSETPPSVLFPVYERYSTYVRVYPPIDTVDLKYLRLPKTPNWTYQTVSGQPMYNLADVAHQDFELHESEFANIVIKMLSYFGIVLREADVHAAAEAVKDKTILKENN